MFLVMRRDDICSAGISANNFSLQATKLCRAALLGREQDGLLFSLTASLLRITEEAEDSFFIENRKGGAGLT